MKLKEKECGRAFYEENCQTCAGVHLTLLNQSLPNLGKFGKEIKSVIVKPGCTLTSFNEEDFDGDETIVTSESGTVKLT